MLVLALSSCYCFFLASIIWLWSMLLNICWPLAFWLSFIWDELPRTIVLIWCSLSIFLIIFLIKLNLINETVFRLVCPNRKLLIISIILIFLVLPDLVVDKLNLHPGWTDENGIRLSNNSYFYDILTFNFVRLSELQEMIFCSYFLYYSKLLLTYNHKLKN